MFIEVTRYIHAFAEMLVIVICRVDILTRNAGGSARESMWGE